MSEKWRSFSVSRDSADLPFAALPIRRSPLRTCAPKVRPAVIAIGCGAERVRRQCSGFDRTQRSVGASETLLEFIHLAPETPVVLGEGLQPALKRRYRCSLIIRNGRCWLSAGRDTNSPERLVTRVEPLTGDPGAPSDGGRRDRPALLDEPRDRLKRALACQFRASLGGRPKRGRVVRSTLGHSQAPLGAQSLQSRGPGSSPPGGSSRPSGSCRWHRRSR